MDFFVLFSVEEIKMLKEYTRGKSDEINCIKQLLLSKIRTYEFANIPHVSKFTPAIVRNCKILSRKKYSERINPFGSRSPQKIKRSTRLTENVRFDVFDIKPL